MRYVARKLEMLLLILADWHEIRLIKQNIRRHERGIREKTEIDVFGRFLALFLELRHTARFAELRVAIEHPGKLRVLRNVRLHEQNALFGIESDCEKERDEIVSATAQILRDVVHRDCVHIRHGVNTPVLVLQSYHIFQRADVVSELQITRGFERAVHDFLFFVFHKIPISMLVASCGKSAYFSFISSATSITA